MKKVNINLSSSQPNFSVVIPVINPYFVNADQKRVSQAELSKIDWSSTCPEFPKLAGPIPAPSYPKIEEIVPFPSEHDNIDNTIDTSDESPLCLGSLKNTNNDYDNKPKLSITKEELLDKCQEEMKNCARSIKRIRDSGIDSDAEIEFKYKLLTVIHEQLEVINMVI